MKKVLALLLGVLILILLSGCANEGDQKTASPSTTQGDAQNSSVEESASGQSDSADSQTPATPDVSGTQNGDSTAASNEEAPTTPTEFTVIEDNGESANEVVGTQVTPTEQALPEEIFGTWSLVEGLPEGLTSYTITINPDGSVKTVADSNGNVSEFDSTCVSIEGGYALVGPSGDTLLTLNLDGNQLSSGTLSPQTAIFEKTEP